MAAPSPLQSSDAGHGGRLRDPPLQRSRESEWLHSRRRRLRDLSDRSPDIRLSGNTPHTYWTALNVAAISAILALPIEARLISISASSQYILMRRGTRR